MQCDVTRCIICISNKVKYLDKEHNYKNSTKEVIQGVSKKVIEPWSALVRSLYNLRIIGTL